MWIAAALVLLLLVLVPLAWLALSSFQDPTTGALTLRNYVSTFSKRIYLEPVLNSFKLAVAVATIAVLVGTPLAWVVSRTDMPGRWLIRPLVLAAFVTPSFLGANAWIFLAAPNSGWLNRIWLALFHGEQGPFNVFSLQGAIFVIALYSIPYTFSLVSGGGVTRQAVEADRRQRPRASRPVDVEDRVERRQTGPAARSPEPHLGRRQEVGCAR